MSKNVLIPLNILQRLVFLFNLWDASDYETVIRDELFDVRNFLNLKLHRVEYKVLNDEADCEYRRLLEWLDEDVGIVPF